MKEHRKNCQCGKDHSKDDFHNASLQEPGMSKIQHRDKITEICEQLYQVGIFIKDKTNPQISKYDGKEEASYNINDKFIDLLQEHYRIQDHIDYLDKRNGVSHKTESDFGELDRDTYIMGITINDFAKLSPKDCEECRNLVMRKRGDEDVHQVFIEHMKKDHPDIHKAQEELGKYMRDWILLIRDFMEYNQKQNNREWRSK